MNALPNLIPITLAAASARTAGTRPNSASSNAFDDVMSAQQSRSQAARTTAPARYQQPPDATPVRRREQVRSLDPQDPRPAPANPATPATTARRDDAARDDRSIRDHGGDADRDDRRDASDDDGTAPDDAARVAQAQAAAVAAAGVSGPATDTPAAAPSAAAAGSAGPQGISGVIGQAGISGVAGAAGRAAVPAGAGAATGGQPIVPGQLDTTGSLSPAGPVVLGGLAVPGAGSLGGQAGVGTPAGTGSPTGPGSAGTQGGAGTGTTQIPPGGLGAPASAGGSIGQPGPGSVPGPATGPTAQQLGQLGLTGQQPSAPLGRSPLQAAPGPSSGPGSATGTGASSSVSVPDPGGVGTTATGASVATAGGQGVSSQPPGAPIVMTDPGGDGQVSVIAAAPTQSAATAAAVQAAVTGTVLPAGIGLNPLGVRASGDQDTGVGGVSSLNPAVSSPVSLTTGTIAPAVAIQPPAPADRAQPVITQVMDHLVKQQLITARNLHDGTHQAVIRLNPANLGHVTVTMDVRAGQVRIDLAAGSQALATLGSDLGQLRSQLADSGLNLAGVTLSAQTTDSGAGQPAPRRDGQPAPAPSSSSSDQPMTDRGTRNDSVRQIRERGGVAAPGSLDLLA